MKKIYRLYCNFYKTNIPLLSTYVACTLVHKFLCFVLPMMTERVMDTAVSLNARSFSSAVIVFIICTLLCGAILAARYWTKDIAENRAVSSEKAEILNDMFRIPYMEIKNNTVGSYLQLLTDDVDKSKGLILYDIPVFVCNIIFTICMVTYLCITDLPLALIVICFVPLFTIITRIMLPKIEAINKEMIAQEECVKDLVDEIYTGNVTVRAANAVPFYHKRIHHIIMNLFHIKERAIHLDILYDLILITGIMSIANAAIYIIGGVRVIQGAITIGTVTSFTLYFSSLWSSVDGFMNFFKEYKVKMLSIDRLVSFHSHTEDMCYPVTSLPAFERLDINAISFSFASNHIFCDFSMSISKGERVLVLGANGSGKSTLAHIIIKLLVPHKGHISYNGIEYDTIDPSALRSRILYVPAEAFVISGSKETNHRGHQFEENTIFDVQRAPDVEYSENTLSSGERKLLQLDRALSQNADVYVLDEPFNFIDKEAKHKLWCYIKEQFVGKTLIIISHDHFIQHECDRVVTLITCDK